MGDDISTLLAAVVHQLSALAANVTNGMMASCNALVCASIQLCSICFEDRDQKEQEMSLLIASFEFLVMVVSKLWLRELQQGQPQASGALRDADAIQPTRNLIQSFNTVVTSTSMEGSRSEASIGSIVAAAITPSGSDRADPIFGEAYSPNDSDSHATLSQFMELLSSLAELFASAHLASIQQSEASSPVLRVRINAIGDQLSEILASMILRFPFASNNKPYILKAAGALFGGVDYDHRPGLLWEVILHPLVALPTKTICIAAAKEIISGSRPASGEFLKTMFFIKPSERRKKKRRRQAVLDRPLSCLHMVVQELYCRYMAHPVDQRIATVEHGHSVLADLLYANELVDLLWAIVRIGDERAIAAFLGLDVEEAQQILEEHRKRVHADTGKRSAVHTSKLNGDEDDAPRPHRRAKRVAQLQDDDDITSSSTRETPVRGQQMGFRLEMDVMSNAFISELLDVTILNALFTVWMSSWKALDEVFTPASQVASLRRDLRLRVTICEHLTALVNDLLGASAVVAKIARSNCFNQLDAFMCRFITKTLSPALLITDAVIYNMQALS